MGARNQVGIVLSYWPAILCSLASQFQIRFLKSIPRPMAGPKFSTLFCPQIKSRWDNRCAIILAHWSLPATMAMRIKFGAQIMNQIWTCGFFSCSGRVSFYAPSIRLYVSQWQTARSKWKWTSIATVPGLCPTTVKILTHLISHYHLP
jgi:hypothetical protein